MVVHRGMRQSDLRDQSAQVEVMLSVAGQHIEGPPTHQSEVRMVIHALHAHLLLQLVEGLRRQPLHQRVGLSRHLHAIDDVVAHLKLTHHLRDTVDVVLQVGVDGDHRVSPLPGSHHPRHDGVLVTHVVRQVDAPHEAVLLVQLADDLPGAVPTAVVHEHHHRVLADESVLNHTLKEPCEPLHGVSQHVFFIIAWRYRRQPDRLH